MRTRYLQESLDTLDGWLTEDTLEIAYLTGLELSLGTFVCTKKEAKIFVDGRYTSYAVANSPIPVGSENPEEFFTAGMKVGFDPDKISFNRHKKFRSDLVWVPSDNLVTALRLLKDSTEQALMKDAGILGAKGMAFCKERLKVGISEKELADDLDYFFKKQGGEGSAFPSIIAFGENSAFPHHKSGKRTLRNNEIVLIDIGATKAHYHSDMTRTFFFGAANPALQKIYSLVDAAQKSALKLCKPGTKIGDLDLAARGLIERAGYGPLFCHGLGHGIGREVHEFPSLKNKEPFKDIALREGMVITIEPGIYQEGLGGVRLEDTFLITEKGYENLTCHGL